MSDKIETAPFPSRVGRRLAQATEDQRVHFAALTAKTPVDPTFRDKFIRSKLRLARTSPAADMAARNSAVESVVHALGTSAQHLLEGQTAQDIISKTPPAPGGVGYGVFYSTAFKTGWGHGTSLAFEIVCPTPPGGNVNTYLYLTATNRSAMGVEAFISYNGQNDTHFRVFDWARNDHWQTDIPLASLSNYLQSASAHGHTYQTLWVWNSTWLVTGSTWRNQVLLFNHVRAGWDLVYQYDYQATDSQQKTGWIGSWAPIVETFQSPYSNTSPMGAVESELISADNSGHWGQWRLLGPQDSSIRTDNVGFQLVFLDPNYGFLVKS